MTKITFLELIKNTLGKSLNKEFFDIFFKELSNELKDIVKIESYDVLSTVFERLLKTKDKKDGGKFYTPKVIVEYMCEESLKSILKNDYKNVGDLFTDDLVNIQNKFTIDELISIKLKVLSLKILDPACGSGNFLLGVLDSIVSLIVKLDKVIGYDTNVYDLKKRVIQNCIYGVDIDKEALEIAKLRLWLSIVIEAGLTKFDNLNLIHDDFLLRDGIGRFDIVIGNPPYVQLQKNGGRLAKLYKQYNYETFKSKGDIYALFYEKGISVLKDKGYLVYITSNKWMRAGYGDVLRDYLSKKNPVKLVDFSGFKVFESATVDTNILIVQNNNNMNHTEAVQFKDDYKKSDNITEYFNNNKTVLDNLSKDSWFIGSKSEINLKAKIERIGKPLKEWDVNIYRGILTGYNEAFIIDTKTKEHLCKEDPKSAEIIKPILRGRDIKRYAYDWAGLWLIATFPALNLDIDKYPAVKNYLKSFGKRIEQTGEKGSRKKTNNKWFEIQDQIGYYEEFEKEKIMYSEIVKQPQFYLDIHKEFYPEATNFILTGNSLKFLTGIFHSKLFTYIFKFFYAGGGLGKSGYRYKKAFIERVPVPKISESNNSIVNNIEQLVDKILEKKKGNANIDTSDLEKEIDKLVYELYELTEDEVNYPPLIEVGACKK